MVIYKSITQLITIYRCDRDGGRMEGLRCFMRHDGQDHARSRPKRIRGGTGTSKSNHQAIHRACYSGERLL